MSTPEGIYILLVVKQKCCCSDISRYPKLFETALFILRSTLYVAVITLEYSQRAPLFAYASIRQLL